jgi:hypothetical protein
LGTIVGTQVSLRYAIEASRGVLSTGGSAPLGYTGSNWKSLRATSRNINLKKDILESAEINTTRQRSDVRHGFNRVEGEIGYELSLNSYDELLTYAMGRPHVARDPANNTQVALTSTGSYDGWVKPGNVTSVAASTVSLATSTAPGVLRFTIVPAGVTTHWIDLGYRPGDWVTSSGFADTDYNSNGALAVGTNPPHWKVLTISTNGADLDVQVPAGYIHTGAPPATETAEVGQTIAFVGRKLSIGTTLTTVSIERAFVDGTASDTYQKFRGCAINTMAMTIRPEAIVGGTFGFIGMGADIDDGATSAGTPTTIGTNSPFSAFDGSATLTNSAGAHIAAVVTGVDFSLDNQRTLFPVVGSKTSYDVYEGVAKVTGTVTLLLESIAHLTAFQDESALSTMVIRMNELGSTTSFMSLVFHRVKYTTADIDPPQNGPVLITCAFEALEQTFTGFTAGDVRSKECFRIQRSTTTIV